jgi:hypothetical protein
MRWLLMIAGVIAAVAIGIVLFGMTLPQNHVASRTARLSAPPETVWKLITNVSDYPTWRRNVDSVEQIDTGTVKRWREISGGDRMTYEARTSEAPLHFVSVIADKGLPFGGSWDYRLSPDGEGTRLTITENGEVYNPLFRFVSRYVMGHTATIDKYLEDLARKTGDTYTPVSG